MKNTRYNIIPSLVGSVVAFLLSLSCITIPKNISNVPQPRVKSRTSAPIDAFALIQKTIVSKPSGCLGTESTEVCTEILKKLPPLESSGSGSGILTISDEGPVVLTAAHVCVSSVAEYFKHGDIIITIESEVSIVVNVPTRGSYKTKLVRLDHSKDLCLLKPESVYTNPVALSKKPPSHGDIVYNISAPFGIGGPQMALIFRGFYSGKGKMPGKKNARFYTIPTRPGSSGSAVFNTNWEIIGVIHTAFVALESVGIGTGWQDVHEFLFPPVKK